MAATTRSKNKNSNVEAFPPSDRELALRGKIRTGWSTVALHQNLKNLGLSRSEMIKIEKVLERAEAVERVNQLRIGVEMKKHQQNKEKHLGDGQRTCLICGVDFSSHQRGRRPVSIHFCDQCGSAVCSLCTLADKRRSGTAMTLCPLCYEEKELWKRSGAWLNNALPVIDISQTELEQFEEQQKLLQSRTFTLGRHTDEATAREFVNPYQLEAESSSDEDDELNSIQLHKSPSPPPAAAAASTAFPPPISFVDKPHLEQALQRPSAQKPMASSTFPRSSSPSDALKEFRGRSESEEPVGQKLQPLGEESDARGGKRLSRRGAMSTKDKDKYDSSRRRVVGSVESSGGSSRASVSPPMVGSPYHRGQDIKSSTVSPLTSQASESSDLTEQLRRQLANPPPKFPPPQLISEVPQKPFDQSGVEVFVEPPTPVPLRPGAAVHRRKKERKEKVKPLEDEFKKVAVGPSSQQPLPPPSKKPPVLSASGDEFNKVDVTGEAAGATQAAAASKPPPPSKPAPVHGSDEFQKVPHKGGVTDEGTTAIAAAASKPPPPNKPAPIHESDEFTKITPKAKPPPRVTPSEEGEFRKVNTSSAKESPSRKLPAVPPPADEFRKVHPKPAETKASPPPPPADEFRKVHPKPKEAPLPPPADEFRKVYSKPAEVKEGFSVLPSEGEFRKVRSKPSEAEEITAKPVSVKKPIPLPRTEIDESRKVKPADTKEPSPPPRTELDEFQRIGVEAVATSTSHPSLTTTIRAEKGQTPPPAIPVELVKQESPRPVPAITPRSKLPKGDGDSQSILSTSSLASQTSRSTPPREFTRDHSPASDQLDVQSKRGLPTRQGEIDDDQALPRFRTRSGAMKPDAQRRSGSPAAAVTTHHQPHQESRESFLETESDDFLPRPRSRSGAIDSRSSISSSSSRGGSMEPSSLHGDTVKSHIPLDWKSSQDESAGSSEDVTQPRMRTRSRAFHGRPPSTRGKQEEPISTSTEEDAPHPRMRTRSRAYHGDSQRPKRFTRSRSPGPRINEAQSVQDPQSSLEIPQSRPRSSSTGQSSIQREISSGRASPGPKPDGAFGSVEFEMEYVEGENLLKVTVAKCKGLRAMDGNGFSDPYVKLFLLPGNRIHKFQTRTVYKSLDPVYDETFMFYSVSMEAMKTKQLCLIVMDYDEFSPDDFIGGTRVKLYEVLYSASNKINIRRLLDDNIVAQTALEDKTRGRVRLSFSYSMEKEVFSVYVHKADRLVPASTKGQCDPYVKCYFESSGTGSSTKKKTSVCKKTLSPVFNQVLEFHEKLIHLGFSRMTVSVWDRNKLPSSEVGSVQFRDAAFWKKFLTQPNLTITEWYTLYAPDHLQGISPKHKLLALQRYI